MASYVDSDTKHAEANGNFSFHNTSKTEEFAYFQLIVQNAEMSHLRLHTMTNFNFVRNCVINIIIAVWEYFTCRYLAKITEGHC
jgi:hypothetical protein